MPDPHDALQEPHSPVYQVGVIGQAFVLHAREVVGLDPAPSEEHCESETVAPSLVHETVRVCVPPPHNSLQVDHEDVDHVAQLPVLQLLEVPGFAPGQSGP